MNIIASVASAAPPADTNLNIDPAIGAGNVYVLSCDPSGTSKILPL